MSFSAGQLDSVLSLSRHPGEPIPAMLVGCDKDRLRITLEFDSEIEFWMAMSGDPVRHDAGAIRDEVNESLMLIDEEAQ